MQTTDGAEDSPEDASEELRKTNARLHAAQKRNDELVYSLIETRLVLLRANARFDNASDRLIGLIIASESVVKILKSCEHAKDPEIKKAIKAMKAAVAKAKPGIQIIG